MDGLEAVAHIRQRPADDHGHGIVDVGTLHLPVQIDVHDHLIRVTDDPLYIYQAFSYS